MTLVAALAAERVKLTTTRSTLWAVLAAAVLGVGFALLQRSAAFGASRMAPEKAVTGVAALGVPVFMVLAALSVTGEYRTGLIRTTFLATPDRSRVLIAKAVQAAAVSALVTAVLSVIAMLAGGVPLATAGAWRTVGAVALYAAVAAVLGVGVGALVRSTAVAVAALLLWPLVIELLVQIIPGIGSRFGPYLPFANAAEFTGVHWLYLGYRMNWGPWGGLAYFAGLAAVLFVAAVIAVDRRDA
jgi:ABC-2 type transport system permease protein